MRINASDTAAAVAMLRSRYGAGALHHAQRHRDTMRTTKGRRQWEAIVAELEGASVVAQPSSSRPDWTEVLPHQWAHSSGRAVVYETATGYEWEVFGTARGVNIPTLEAAQAAAEGAIV